MNLLSQGGTNSFGGDIDMGASNLNLGGTSLIGQDVKTTSNFLWLEGGEINSTYAIGDGAVEAEAIISDPLGRVVRRIKGLSTDPFVETPLVWDGLDDAGNPQLDGAYKVELKAKDADGKAVSTEVSRTATVKEVIFQEGEILFKLTGDEIVSSVTVLSAS